jgi:hypothetical protein
LEAQRADNETRQRDKEVRGDDARTLDQQDAVTGNAAIAS